MEVRDEWGWTLRWLVRGGMQRGFGEREKADSGGGHSRGGAEQHKEEEDIVDGGFDAEGQV